MSRLETNKTYLAIVLFRISSGVENTSTVTHNNNKVMNMIILYKVKFSINLDIFHSHIPIVFDQGRNEALNAAIEIFIYLHHCR